VTGVSRRSLLTALASGAGAALAGCAGSDGSEGATATDTPVDSATPAIETPYTASIEPVGEVTFEAVPERWVTYKLGYADIAFALGQGDGLVGLDRPETYLTPMRELFYSQLPGTPVPSADAVTDIRGGGSIDKETFYAMDADVHLIDPRLPRFYFEWTRDDVETIRDNVGPFFGSFARRKLPRDYEFYTMYEIRERVARVFRTPDRYEAWVALHDDVQARIDERLPPVDERPSVALLAGGSDPSAGEFFAMDPTRAGYETKQYRDLRVGNALAEYTERNDGVFTRIDYEVLLETDPDLIVFHWRLQEAPEAFEAEFIEPMREHPVGGEITAVQDEEVYRGGSAEQGPILSLFQTELFATQQYPDRFGSFPGVGERPAEPLFDRQRVADIISGAV